MSCSSACRTPARAGDGTEHYCILGEQDRRQLLAPIDRGFIGRTPCIEKLHQLLARGVVVPFAIALDDGEQMFERVLAATFAVEGDRKIEPRLMIERIGATFCSSSPTGPTVLACSASSSAAREAATAGSFCLPAGTIASVCRARSSAP